MSVGGDVRCKDEQAKKTLLAKKKFSDIVTHNLKRVGDKFSLIFINDTEKRTKLK